MLAKFFQFKKNLFLTILLLAIFVLPSKALAENLLTVGSASSSLSGTDSAIFANVSNTSPTSTFLLMLQSGSTPKFNVDKFGNVNTPGTVTAGSFSGPLSGTISAANVTPGAFNSTLNAGGNFSFPASLGIGVSVPVYPLHISSSGADTGLLLQNNTTTLNNSASLRFLVSTSASPSNEGARLIFTRTDSPAAADGDLSFWTRGSGVPTERMRITSNGNVGIGTTTPGSLLTVGNNLGLTTGGTIYGALASRYLDLSGVLPLSLNLPGPIKFGNTANACDSTNTGALRYDSVSGQTYLCDGSRWLNQKNCGLMTDDEGHSYNTVQIGGQCWMAENINIGTMLASGATMPTTNDQIIEKWCYNSDPANCAAYGGLYHFDEAVRGSKVSGARGICPAGWHVPTDTEFNILEKTVSGIISSAVAQYPCNLSVAGWRRCADDNGTDAGGATGVGKSLKAVGVGNGNNLVGFEGKLSGYRNTGSSFSYLGSYLYLWSSSPSGSSSAWYRYLYSSYSTVYRNAHTRARGFSVRCVRD